MVIIHSVVYQMKYAIYLKRNGKIIMTAEGGRRNINKTNVH